MTITQIIGALMILTLFAAVFVAIGIIERSWRVPTAIFAITLALFAFLAAGVTLMLGGIQ